MCVATLTRNTASALTTVLIAMFAPWVVGAMVPKWWQEHVVILFPGVATDALASGHLTKVDEYLHPAWGALITLGWIGGLLAIATVVFTRRDA